MIRLTFALIYFFMLQVSLIFSHQVTHKPITENKPEAPKELNMLVVGDWGGLSIDPYYTKYEVGTAISMGKKARELNADCVFTLGDNFYSAGVWDEYDPRFNQTFENVFNDSSLTSIPWYNLAGNHDHVGNISGEIEYSNHSERWIFPNLWYHVVLHAEDFNITVLMIDTIVLCGGTELEFLYTTTSTKTIRPSGPENVTTAEEQWAYIERVLAESNSHYLIVMGHYPVYSVAEHGTEPCMYERLKPMLEKYKATAYMAGHDHQLQHILVNEVDYFINAAANSVNIQKRNLEDVPFGSLMYYWAKKRSLGGYGSITANRTKLIARFHSSEDTSTLYERIIEPRNASSAIKKNLLYVILMIWLIYGLS